MLRKGATPCGLAARDVLRLEAAYPLYGRELTDDVTPLDAGLRWTVKLDKGPFVGKEALVSYTPVYRQVKLILPKGIPREGYPILNEEGRKIGVVTSGSLSVVLGRGVALGRLERGVSGREFYVEIRGRPYRAELTKKSFNKQEES